MTDDDLQQQAQLIAESQEKFVATVRNLSHLVDSLIKHQSSFMKYLDTWRELFVSSRDLMQEHDLLAVTGVVRIRPSGTYRAGRLECFDQVLETCACHDSVAVQV